MRWKLEDACYRRRWTRNHARPRPASTQTEPQPPTSVGVTLPETGQFLLLCSLQLWQQLQRCRRTRAIFFTHFTSVLRRERYVS